MLDLHFYAERSRRASAQNLSNPTFDQNRCAKGTPGTTQAAGKQVITAAFSSLLPCDSENTRIAPHLNPR